MASLLISRRVHPEQTLDGFTAPQLQHRAPEALDDVPARAPEHPFELLDDLAVAPHRAIQSLQVTVHHEHQVIQLFAPRQSESAEVQSDIALYAGQQTRGNLCICPALAEWISNELRSEPAISKERRKAREAKFPQKPK